MAKISLVRTHVRKSRTTGRVSTVKCHIRRNRKKW